MNRDKDLIRKLLLAIETKPDGRPMSLEDFVIDHHSVDQINSHLALMDEAGLIACECLHSSSNRSRVTKVVQIFGITWKGHEWLDAIRNREVWLAAQEAARVVSDPPFELLIEMAKRNFLSRLHDAA